MVVQLFYIGFIRGATKNPSNHNNSFDSIAYIFFLLMGMNIIISLDIVKARPTVTDKSRYIV
jgi:hypothetical protein